MATQRIEVTETAYVEISTAGALISAYSAGQIIVTNADALPSVDTVGHPVSDGESRVFPAPASGSWYAKASIGSGSVIVTEI